ncbi:MAG TPA: condensation domain-containing protein [Streptosporangiaceae bacterium]|nr:condensation domain-containing protein [Streptosporangiaceae bacterium]
MAPPQQQHSEPSDGYPLSFTQDFFCSLDQGDAGGAFGLRFIIVSGWRISGEVDIAALQDALNDVVVRHELLRTIVDRDAVPPRQFVQPPCAVPLETRDLTADAGKSRDVLAAELVVEAEHGTMSPQQVPLLRAVLARLGPDDWALVMTVHHSACDGWSMQLVMRDLAAFYTARTSNRPPDLPEVRQYREYAIWQRASLADAATAEARSYWREKLAGARVFTLPNDHARPEVYTRPYTAYHYTIGTEVMTRAAKLAAETRCSPFMLLLAVFNVLGYQITGSTDLSIRAFTTGRNELQFHNTTGLFMNLVPFRTDIGDCATFRDVIARTRDTCIDAYANEIPIHHVEQLLPDLNAPHQDPRNSQFIMGMFQPQFDEAILRIADGLTAIDERVLPDPEQTDIPNGLVWDLTIMASGELAGKVAYNRDEFDPSTVESWASDHCRILKRALSNPDQSWKTL